MLKANTRTVQDLTEISVKKNNLKSDSEDDILNNGSWSNYNNEKVC